MKYTAHDAWEWERSVILQRRLIHLQNWGIWEKWDEIITDTNTLIKILIQEFNKEFIWLFHVSQLNECTLTLPLHVSGFWWWFWPDRERVWLSICNSVRLEMISRLVKWKKTLISLNLWEESEYTKVNMDGKRKTSKVRVVLRPLPGSALSQAKPCGASSPAQRCSRAATAPDLRAGQQPHSPGQRSSSTVSLGAFQVWIQPRRGAGAPSWSPCSTWHRAVPSGRLGWGTAHCSPQRVCFP